MRARFWLTVLALLLAAGCNDTGKASEEDLGGDDTTQDAAGDTAPPQDTTVDTADVPDATDTALDDTAADTADLGDTPDVVLDACQGPVRLVPDTVSAAGGEVVVVEGYEWYIGALWWNLGLEVPDGRIVVAESPGSVPVGPCQLAFRLPPLEPFDYPAQVYYGSPDHGMTPPEQSLVLHVEAATGPWAGATPCDLGQGCAEQQVCQLGLGFCAWQACDHVTCHDGSVCDPLEGCGWRHERPECESGADCALLYSECGCIAVPASDPRLAQPRPQLSSCALGACESCETNACDTLALWAHCDPQLQRCVPMPPL